MIDPKNPPVEVIAGQIVSKTNNYMVAKRGNADPQIIKNAKIREYERLFATQCRIYRNAHIGYPFQLVADVYVCNNKFDLDNSVKTLLDCLQYVGAIENDNLCRKIVASKYIDVTHPRIAFSIVSLPGGSVVQHINFV